MKKEMRRVVVTGLGPIASVGIGVAEFWRGVHHKKVQVDMENFFIDGKFVDRFPVYRHADRNFFKKVLDACYHLDLSERKKDRAFSDLSFLLTAAKLALADGGLEDVDCGADAGLFLSHENPGVMQFVEKFAFDIYELLCDAKKLGKKVFLNKIYEKHAENIFDLQGFVFLFKIAKALNLHGLSLITNNACSSGLYSLEVASETIRNGHNEMALVVAVDRPDVFKYWWFKKLGIYSATGVISPFSEEANGFVFGEGGGGVLLEDYNHALKRGAKIYAEYLGGAFSLEGWKVVLPNTNKDSYKKMLISMLNRCGISSSEVDLVVPHGVGASVIDRYEATALEQVFGKNKKNIKPFYTAFKPFFGHCLGGSSLLEAILLILALKNEEIPPTLNYGKPSRKIGISFVDDFLKMKIKIAVKSSAAFAGFDASVAFKRIDDEF